MARQVALAQRAESCSFEAMLRTKVRQVRGEIVTMSAALLGLAITASPSSAQAQSAAAAPVAAAPAAPVAAPPGSPPRKPYREGAPIPQGYHVEQRVRKGMVIAGAITLGIPYTIGLAAAGGSNFRNESGWLALPALGPFITLGRRHADCHTGSKAASCLGDVMLGFGLVLDGLAQTAGATLLLIGVSAPKTELVRNDVMSLSVLPGRVGTSGYGLRAVGQF